MSNSTLTRAEQLRQRRAQQNRPTNGPHSSPTNGPHSSPTNGPHSSPTNGPHSSPTNGPHSSPTNGLAATLRGVLQKIQTTGQEAHSRPRRRTAAAQPSQRAAAQPSQRAAAQPSQRAAAQPSQRAAAQPSQRAAVQPSQRAAVQPSQRAAVQPSQRAATQPIITRRTITPTNTRMRTVPVAERARTETRRQYYYTISSTGAEVRLPAIPNLQFGERGLSAILALILIVALFILLQSSTFAIQSVTVRGLERLNSEEITAILNLEGENIFSINRTALLAQIGKEFPELKDIRLTVGLPAQVSLSASERQPILVWATGEQTLWIDQQGFIFPARGILESSLPIVESDELPPFQPTLETTPPPPQTALDLLQPERQVWGNQMDAQMLDTAMRLLPQVPEGATLTYSPFSGLGWNDPAGWRVFIGRNLQDMDVKLLEYQTIVAYLGSQGITPAVVSVETIHAPFYRMEP